VGPIGALTRGGIYLARPDPARGAEVGKLRPIIVLTAQSLLDAHPHLIFICPLSSKSAPEFAPLHIHVQARDRLRVASYALVEHCRAISARRIQSDRLAQLTSDEVDEIIRRLQRLLGS